MMLATTRVQDFDRWMKIFTDRVWVLFDWDEQGWKDVVSDPEVPSILKDAGHKEKPQIAALAGRLGS